MSESATTNQSTSETHESITQTSFNLRLDKCLISQLEKTSKIELTQLKERSTKTLKSSHIETAMAHFNRLYFVHQHSQYYCLRGPDVTTHINRKPFLPLSTVKLDDDDVLCARDLNCRYWLFVLNIDTNHWVLVRYDRHRSKLLVFDSLRSPQISNDYKEQLDKLSRNLGEGTLQCTYDWAECTQQKDLFSCGRFVIEHARALLTNKPVTQVSTKETDSTDSNLIKVIESYRNSTFDRITTTNDHLIVEDSDLVHEEEIVHCVSRLPYNVPLPVDLVYHLYSNSDLGKSLKHLSLSCFIHIFAVRFQSFQIDAVPDPLLSKTYKKFSLSMPDTKVKCLDMTNSKYDVLLKIPIDLSGKNWLECKIPHVSLTQRLLNKLILDQAVSRCSSIDDRMNHSIKLVKRSRTALDDACYSLLYCWFLFWRSSRSKDPYSLFENTWDLMTSVSYVKTVLRVYAACHRMYGSHSNCLTSMSDVSVSEFALVSVDFPEGLLSALIKDVVVAGRERTALSEVERNKPKSQRKTTIGRKSITRQKVKVMSDEMTAKCPEVTNVHSLHFKDGQAYYFAVSTIAFSKDELITTARSKEAEYSFDQLSKRPANSILIDRCNILQKQSYTYVFPIPNDQRMWLVSKDSTGFYVNRSTILDDLQWSDLIPGGYDAKQVASTAKANEAELAELKKKHAEEIAERDVRHAKEIAERDVRHAKELAEKTSDLANRLRVLSDTSLDETLDESDGEESDDDMEIEITQTDILEATITVLNAKPMQDKLGEMVAAQIKKCESERLILLINAFEMRELTILEESDNDKSKSPTKRKRSSGIPVKIEN